jgi:hypothetical protein
MSRQTLKLRRGEVIVIETPEGLLRVKMLDKFRFELELPGGMVAHRSEDRAMTGARFLQKDGERLVPKYQILQPITDQEGEIKGVRQPPVFRVATA